MSDLADEVKKPFASVPLIGVKFALSSSRMSPAIVLVAAGIARVCGSVPVWNIKNHNKLPDATRLRKAIYIGFEPSKISPRDIPYFQTAAGIAGGPPVKWTDTVGSPSRMLLPPLDANPVLSIIKGLRQLHPEFPLTDEEFALFNAAAALADPSYTDPIPELATTMQAALLGLTAQANIGRIAESLAKSMRIPEHLIGQ